jgi:phosphoenolpyruvate-protein phosphotransferase
VARELLPSETIDLDREHVVGIVTEEGGENSHAAILARGLGIPAVTAVPDAVSRIAPGTRLLIDGAAGRVTISPTVAATADMSVLKRNYDETSTAAEDAESLDCVTKDGLRVSLLANLNRIGEARLVEAHQLAGVGLFRTEFLYMDSPSAPDYSRHLQVYQRLLRQLGGRRLVIRTLDLGGDKIPLFLARHREENPNLGLRGLRFSLARGDLFTPQLRALLAASQEGDLGVLFPMVLGESDLAEAVQRVQQLGDEMSLPRLPRLGAMIETPSALFSLNEILRQVDFVSIGTNDLTQFMLAADRDAADLMDDYSFVHPSVLRAIRKVVEACDEAGCDVSVCGEAAGDTSTACLLVGLGIRQLSMSPVRAARVRLAIRQTDSHELVDLAEQSLRADSSVRVKELLRQLPCSDHRSHRPL